MIFDSQHGALAMFGVAFIITVGELRLDFSQIASITGRPPGSAGEAAKV